MNESLLRKLAVIGIMGNALIDIGVDPSELMAEDEAELLFGLLDSIDAEQYRKIAVACVQETVRSAVKEAPANVNEI